MAEPVIVCVRQCFAHVAQDVQPELRLTAPLVGLQQITHVIAIYDSHRDEAKSVEAAGLVDGANALVIEFGDPQGFVEIRELELIHELECNQVAEPLVVGEENHAFGTAPDFGDDGVVPKLGSGFYLAQTNHGVRPRRRRSARRHRYLT
jgi:hypothetical protein